MLTSLNLRFVAMGGDASYWINEITRYISYSIDDKAAEI